MNIAGYQRVSLNRYKTWTEQIDATQRF